MACVHRFVPGHAGIATVGASTAWRLQISYGCSLVATLLVRVHEEHDQLLAHRPRVSTRVSRWTFWRVPLCRRLPPVHPLLLVFTIFPHQWAAARRLRAGSRGQPGNARGRHPRTDHCRYSRSWTPPPLWGPFNLVVCLGLETTSAATNSSLEATSNLPRCPYLPSTAIVASPIRRTVVRIQGGSSPSPCIVHSLLCLHWRPHSMSASAHQEILRRISAREDLRFIPYNSLNEFRS